MLLLGSFMADTGVMLELFIAERSVPLGVGTAPAGRTALGVVTAEVT